MRVTGKQVFHEFVQNVTVETVLHENEIARGTIGGNAAQPVTLKGMPIHDVIAVDGALSSQFAYEPYDPTFEIPANIFNRKADVGVSYKYRQIKDSTGVINNLDVSSNGYGSLPNYATQNRNPISKIRVNGTTDAFANQASLLDSEGEVNPSFELEIGNSEYLYYTPYSGETCLDSSGKLPITPVGVSNTEYKGVTIAIAYKVPNPEYDETTNPDVPEYLTQTLDASEYSYQVSFDDNTHKAIIMMGTTNLPNNAYDAVITANYYTYAIANNTETFTLTEEEGTCDTVVLDHTQKAGTAVVKVGPDDANMTVITTGFSYNATTRTYTFNANKNLNVNDKIVITYSWEEELTENNKMTIQAIYGGSLYKNARVKIEPYTQNGTNCVRIIFTKPESKRATNDEQPFYFTSNTCPTIGALKLALAQYVDNNVFEIICDNDDMLLTNFLATDINLDCKSDSDTVDAEPKYTDAELDGVVISNNAMFEALSGKRNPVDGGLIETGAYQILENYNVDYIYVAGIYANSVQSVNPNSNFHYELALLCAVLTYRTKMTHGFIDMKPNNNTTLQGVQNYVDGIIAWGNANTPVYMRDYDGNYILDDEKNKMDIGWYTSIVVGPEPIMTSDTLGVYYGSPSIAYAALAASLKPQSSPMNKGLIGVRGMKYRFSNKQLNELVGARMVCFRMKNDGLQSATSTPYVVDAMTAGGPACDYKRLTTVQIVTDVVDQIREVADPFIGEPNTIEQRNALSALIDKRLGYLAEQGEIQYYEFQIDATVQQILLGECSIALTLVCPMELRKITTVVALRAAA